MKAYTRNGFYIAVAASVPLLILGLSYFVSDKTLSDVLSPLSRDGSIENMLRMRSLFRDFLICSSLIFAWFFLICVSPADSCLEGKANGRLRISTYVSFFFAVSVVAAYLVHRYLFTLPLIFSKEGLLEILTAICLFIATLILFRGSIVAWSLRKHLRYSLICGFLLFGALACLFVGLEEISWGQHYLGFETPDWIKKHNYQSEFTAHNLMAQGELDLYSQLVLWTLFGVAVTIVLAQRFLSNNVLTRIAPDPNLIGLSLTSALTCSLLHPEPAEFLLSIAALHYAILVRFRVSADSQRSGIVGDKRSRNPVPGESKSRRSVRLIAENLGATDRGPRSGVSKA